MIPLLVLSGLPRLVDISRDNVSSFESKQRRAVSMMKEIEAARRPVKAATGEPVAITVQQESVARRV